MPTHRMMAKWTTRTSLASQCSSSPRLEWRQTAA
jgi:hypothetical protein